MTKLLLLIKQKGIISNSVFNEGKPAITPAFIDPEKSPSTSDKAKLFAHIFSKNSNLDVFLYLLASPSRTNLKLHEFALHSCSHQVG